MTKNNNEEEKEEKIPKGLKSRPLYDPTIEQLNDKAREVANKRSRENRFNRTTSHELQTSQGRTEGLKEHGKRINPNPQQSTYIGSFCVHIYGRRNIVGMQGDTVTLEFISLTPGIESMDHSISQEALKALGLHIMKSFGIDPPETLDKRKQKEQTIVENL